MINCCDRLPHKHGKNRQGYERYKCPACGKTFTDNPTPHKAGRKPIAGQAMTAAERQRKKRKQQKEKSIMTTQSIAQSIPAIPARSPQPFHLDSITSANVRMSVWHNRLTLIAHALKIPRFQVFEVHETGDGVEVECNNGERHSMTLAEIDALRWKVCEFGCVRWDGQAWWVMNHRSKGWSSFGFFSKDLTKLEATYRFKTDDQAQTDETGEYYPIWNDLFFRCH